MILSMTGFGKAQGNYKHTTYTAEVRSVNSKQLDLNLRLNSALRDQEMELRKNLASELVRGKVDIAVYVEGVSEDKMLSVNQELFDRYAEMLKTAADKQGLDQSGLLANVLKLPEVLQSERKEKEQEEIDLAIGVLMEAVKRFQEFRSTEGQELRLDLTDRLNNIRNLMTQVEQYEGERIETVRQRMMDRFEELKEKVTLDESRLESELMYYIEKFDVTEEKVRLTSHLKYFEETMNSDEAAGRKLGFISQEMGREINTLGSKANHAEIQRIVVQMKDELEKIKEQVLNVL
ncbi:MAG: YicC family protein [Flavobacteriales bacterium]|nr:YicC family protein [Flavobacteriales bacterium]MCB9203689.1 YicC family protein [Flavobacteriales bacterium]